MKLTELLQTAFQCIGALFIGPPDAPEKVGTTWTVEIMKDLAISPNDLPAIARDTFRLDETRRQR